MVKTQQLLRFSGLAAGLGGLGRMASALPLPLDQASQEALWTVIDILFTFGLIGIYLVRAEALGFLGLAAFVVAMAALSFIGGPDADVFGFSTYQEGAMTLAIAMAGLSIAWIRTGQKPIAPPALWFGSIVAAGLLGMVPAAADYGFMAAGLLFGAGFVAAGWDLVSRSGQ
jgi:hypothetical protein